MSDIFEVFGDLAFPNAAEMSAWNRSFIDDISCEAVAAFAGERHSNDPEKVSDVLAIHVNSISDYVEVLEQDARIEVSMMFDENLLSDYGPMLLGAIAQAAKHGATGVIHIVEGGFVIHSLTFANGAAKLDKQKKSKRVSTLPEAEPHQQRILEWVARRTKQKS